MTNVGTSWLEMLVNPYREQQRARDAGANFAGEGAAALGGFFSGMGYTLARVGVGVLEIGTFVVPTDPWMEPPVPYSAIEMLGPPPPHSFFRSTRHYDVKSHIRRAEWEKARANDEAFYQDRWECAAATVRTGRFDACLEERGWSRAISSY